MSRIARLWQLVSVFCLVAALQACSDDTGPPLAVQQVKVESGCDPRASCIASAPGFSARVSMGPDMHVLKAFPVVVQIESDTQVKDITFAASMQGMDMGLNRYRLQETGADGQWRADVILPICVSGRTDWIGLLEVRTGDLNRQIQLSFWVDK